MFDSPLLEAAIGMTLIFLLLSLVVSAVNELVLGHLARWRSHVLEEGIRALLTGVHVKGSTTLRILGAILSVTTWKFRGMGRDTADKRMGKENHDPNQAGQKEPAPELPDSIADALLRSPLIRGLASPGVACPGYLPAETFADALLALLHRRGAGASDGGKEAGTPADLLRNLGAGQAYAGELLGSLFLGVTTLPQARERLIQWFNQSMEIVSGTYRRHTQFCMHFWAAIVVIVLNVDAIGLSQRLMSDKALRAALVSKAEQWRTESRSTNAPAPVLSMELAQLRTNIHQLRIPLGWDIPDGKTNPAKDLDLVVAGVESLPNPTSIWGWFLKVLGLLVSIAAISQGAPFWFDLLNRMTNLRAGTKPSTAKAPEAN